MFRICVILGVAGMMILWSALLISIVWLDSDVDLPCDETPSLGAGGSTTGSDH